MKIVNLTPHPLRLFASKEAKEPLLEVQPSGVIARVAVSQKQIGEVLGFPVFKQEYGEVQGLPQKPEEDTIYVVSSLVLNAVASNQKLRQIWEGHLASPNTAQALRDESGRIVGVVGLVIL